MSDKNSNNVELHISADAGTGKLNAKAGQTVADILRAAGQDPDEYMTELKDADGNLSAIDPDDFVIGEEHAGVTIQLSQERDNGIVS